MSRGILGLAIAALAGCGDAVERGRVGYERYCLTCHGPAGAGDGPAAAGMWPPPRDLRAARFKFAAAEEGELPRDEELRRVIGGGLDGTAMLGWDVPPDELADIVAYVKTLSPPGRGFRDPARAVAAPLIIRDPYAGAAPPPAVIARGEHLYHAGLQCAQCHPAYGAPSPRAVDPAAAAPKWSPTYQTVLVPPDFRRDPLRSVRRDAGGHRADDLYRVVARGLQGAMPSYGHLDPADLWAVVYYVRSLGAPPRPGSPAPLDCGPACAGTAATDGN